MGLDMYLKKVTRECNKKISEEVGGWRKANQIHKWFVDNVQDGVDNCATYPVAYEQLQELLSLVNQVLENHKLAAKLLPTSIECFFGSDVDSYEEVSDNEYDKWYFDDLKKTKRIIEATFYDDETVEYEYTSSW